MTATEPKMPRAALTAAFLVLAAGGALLFRVPRLAERPMHVDEANHAVKAGILLEEGLYEYDPRDFHGPTLYYFALPVLRLCGVHDLAGSNETMFRIVPVMFGVGLILLLYLVRDGLGGGAVCAAAVLTAVSPAMVYYSRYYIQETLLVFFTFAALACGWRYMRSRRWGWALAAGSALGMMQATKETSVLAYGAMLGAWALLVLWRRCAPDGVSPPPRARPRAAHLLAAAIPGLALCALFLSGFLTHPRGCLDAVLTYVHYLDRAGGAGLHDHPWHYYLQTLVYAKLGYGAWWSEGLIVGLALVGAAAALAGRCGPGADPKLARFLALYTVLLTAAYSVIPYKTPWCLLSFLHGMILLAGLGAVVLVRLTPYRLVRAGVVLALCLLSAQLGRQAYRASFVYYADTRNPYVYAHTSTNFLRLANRIEELAGAAPEGHDLLIKVITPDYWPLPWYLRRFSRVGYWNSPPATPDAPIVVTSPELEESLRARFRDTYQVSHYGLRPEVLITLCVRTDLWEAFMKSRS